MVLIVRCVLASSDVVPERTYSYRSEKWRGNIPATSTLIRDTSAHLPPLRQGSVLMLHLVRRGHERPVVKADVALPGRSARMNCRS